jgi:beta-lactamase regulating signal transducer with metallopeptidase domain
VEEEGEGVIVEDEPAAIELAVPAVVAQPVAGGWHPGWIRALAGVWLIGSLAWFSLAIRRAWRFSRALRYAKPASDSLRARAEALARQIGLRRCPAILLLPGRVAPLVWGMGRPRLLVPEGLESRMSEAALDTLLLHELAHVRRRDHLVRWLEFLALGAFWWNPIAWYARRELREAEEQCCDAWVVRTLPEKGRTYATALVDALDFLCDARPALPALASGLGEVTDLKRRLKMILRGNTPHALGRSSWLVVLGLAVLLLPFVPGLGQTQEGPRTRDQVFLYRAVLAPQPGDPDLQKLQAEIEKRAAEIAHLRAKLEQLKAEKAKAAQDGRERQLGTSGREAGRGGPVIRIEIIGLSAKPDELKKLAATLEKMLPGKEKRVLISLGAQPKGIFFRVEGGRMGDPVLRGAVPVPGAGLPPLPGMLPPGPHPGAATEKRLDNLEKALQGVIRQLESLRKDIRDGQGTGKR